MIQRQISESIGIREKKFRAGRKKCIRRFFFPLEDFDSRRNFIIIISEIIIILDFFFQALIQEILMKINYFFLSAFEEEKGAGEKVYLGIYQGFKE